MKGTNRKAVTRKKASVKNAKPQDLAVPVANQAKRLAVEFAIHDRLWPWGRRKIPGTPLAVAVDRLLVEMYRQWTVWQRLPIPQDADSWPVPECISYVGIFPERELRWERLWEVAELLGPGMIADHWWTAKTRNEYRCFCHKQLGILSRTVRDLASGRKECVVLLDKLRDFSEAQSDFLFTACQDAPANIDKPLHRLHRRAERLCEALEVCEEASENDGLADAKWLDNFEKNFDCEVPERYRLAAKLIVLQPDRDKIGIFREIFGKSLPGDPQRQFNRYVRAGKIRMPKS